MVGTVELVMFAIQAGIKLFRTGRTIYVEDTRAQEITIPLPAAFSDLSTKALRYLQLLRGTTDEATKERYKERYEGLFKQLSQPNLPAEKRSATHQQIVQLYLLDVADGRVPEVTVSSPELVGLTAVRQWKAGAEPFPHPLQRVAGALVEVTIDYFTQVPGAVNEDSDHGRTIKAFLEGLDEFDFQTARWDSIVIKLFVAGLDAVSDNPNLLAKDEETRETLSAIVSGVAIDVQERLDELPAVGDLDAETRIARAGQVVLRSILRTSGDVVLNNPKVLGLERASQVSVVQSVGSTLLGLLLDDTGDDNEFSVSAALNRTFSTEGADRMIRTFLSAAAENPEFFGIENKDIETWLTNVLTGLNDNHPDGKTFFDPTMLSEVAFLVVDHGLRDLPTLLKFNNEGQKALLVDVAREVFDALTDPPTATKPARWKFKLAREDVLGLFSNVMGSISNNPQWLFERPEHQTLAAELLRFGVDVLSNLGEGNFKTLLRSGSLESVLAATLSSGLLAELSDNDAKTIARVANRVIGAVVQDGVSGLSVLLSQDVLTDVLNGLNKSGVLDKLIGGTPSEKRKITSAIVAVTQSLRGGEQRSVAEISKALSDAA